MSRVLSAGAHFSLRRDAAVSEARAQPAAGSPPDSDREHRGPGQSQDQHQRAHDLESARNLFHDLSEMHARASPRTVVEWVIAVGATSSERTVDHLSILARRSPIGVGDPRMTDAESCRIEAPTCARPAGRVLVSSAG